MTQLRLRSSSFHEHGSGSSSGALGFHECDSVSGSLIFQASGSSSVFCSFSHINIFNCLGVHQVEWKMNYNKYTKLKEYTKLFKYFNLVIFYQQRSYHEEINEKTTITGSDDSENCFQRNVDQDNDNTVQTTSGKAVAGFAVNAWGPFVISYDQNRKWLLGKLHLCPSIWTQTSTNWPSVLHSLHAFPIAVLAIPANSATRANHAKSAKHVDEYLPHVLFLTCTHLH